MRKCPISGLLCGTACK